MFDEDNKMDHDIEDLKKQNEDHDKEIAKSGLENEGNQTKAEESEDLEALDYIDEPKEDDEQNDGPKEATDTPVEKEKHESDPEEVKEESEEDEKQEESLSEDKEEDVGEEELPEPDSAETSDELIENEVETQEKPEADSTEQPEDPPAETKEMETVPEEADKRDDIAGTAAPAVESDSKKTGSHPPLVIIVALIVMFLLVAVAFWAYQDSKSDRVEETQSAEVIVPATESDVVEEINDVDAVIIELDELGSPEDLPVDDAL